VESQDRPGKTAASVWMLARITDKVGPRKPLGRDRTDP
jgi:hypothetical protein